MSEAKTSRPWKDEATLRRLYVERELAQREVVDRLGCAQSTVHRWLDEHGLLRCQETPEGLQNKEVMDQLYHDEELSTYEIADRLGTNESTVRYWLRKHDIERRGVNGERTPTALTEKSQLKHLYCDQGLTTYEIARRAEVAARTVSRWLDKHDIETRTQVDYRTPEELKDSDWLKEMYQDEGKTMEEIGEELDVTADCVFNWVKKHNITPRRAGSRAGEDASNWKGGYEGYYGPNWPEAREKTLRRDGHTCQRCGMSNAEHLEEFSTALHVHHIRPFREFDDAEEANQLKNLVTLCRRCHGHLEGVPIDTRESDD